MVNKEKQYLGHKRYLKISRLVSALVGIFVFIMILTTSLSNVFAGFMVIAMSIGFLWWIVIDNMSDRYEERLIDYEIVHKIKKKK